MGVVINTGYGQVTFVLACAGAPANLMWTHGFKDNGATPTPDVAAADWAAIAVAAGRPYAPGNYGTQYTLVRVDAVIGTATGPLIASEPVNVVGTLVAEAVPVNSAILMQKATARGGRRGRGRAYLPPCHVAEGNIGPSGTIASGNLTTVQGWYDALLAAADIGDYPPYLLHSSSEIAPDHVLAWPLQAKLATQRTRMRK